MVPERIIIKFALKTVGENKIYRLIRGSTV